MAEALPDDLDVIMEPAEVASVQHRGEQQQRPGGQLQGMGQQPRQHTQGADQQRPGGQRQQGGQREPQLNLVAGSQLRGQWHEDFQYQLGEVLAVSDNPAIEGMSAAARQQLWDRFAAAFAADLQRNCYPADSVVRGWLHDEMGIQQGSYGSGYGSSSSEGEGRDGELPAPGRHQRQQQRQQSKPAAPRRSTRANRGQQSAAYTAVHGPSMGQNAVDAGGRRIGGGGKGGSNSCSQPTMPAPSTPSAPQRRRAGRGGGQT